MHGFILNNGTILKTVPPVTYKNDLAKTRALTFETDLPYEDLFNLLSDYGNICRIACTFESGNIADTLTDCVSLKVLSRKTDGTYTAEFSTDATERMIQELRAKVEQLETQIGALTSREEVAPEEEDAPEEDAPEEDAPEEEIPEENPDDPEGVDEGEVDPEYQEP